MIKFPRIFLIYPPGAGGDFLGRCLSLAPGYWYKCQRKWFDFDATEEEKFQQISYSLIKHWNNDRCEWIDFEDSTKVAIHCVQYFPYQKWKDDYEKTTFIQVGHSVSQLQNFESGHFKYHENFNQLIYVNYKPIEDWVKSQVAHKLPKIRPDGVKFDFDRFDNEFLKARSDYGHLCRIIELQHITNSTSSFLKEMTRIFNELKIQNPRLDLCEKLYSDWRTTWAKSD